MKSRKMRCSSEPPFHDLYDCAAAFFIAGARPSTLSRTCPTARIRVTAAAQWTRHLRKSLSSGRVSGMGARGLSMMPPCGDSHAGCSVGAFYSRFRNKDAFLRMVSASAFRTLTDDAKRDLDPNQWRGASKAKIVDGIVHHIVNRMSRGRAAGVTRATLKLSMSKPDALEPFINYRASVADCAVALLTPRLSFDDAAGSVRIAVQMIFGIVTDATLQNAGPLRAGSRRMVNSLSALLTSYLGLPANRRATDGDDEDDEAREPERDDTEAPERADADSTVRMEKWDPDTRSAVGTVIATRPIRRRSRRNRASEPSAKPLPLENPKHVRPPEPLKADEKARPPGRDGKRKLRRI